MFKKSISFCLIVSQLCLSAAFASTRPGEMTAERQLVESVLTLKALGLSDQDLHMQMESTLKDYDAKASKEGRDERLGQAFVDLRVLSPQQARTMIQNARQAEANLAGQSFDSPEARGQALQAQLEMFARVNPVGAQFSACQWGYGLAIAGAVAVLVGYEVANHNPTCHPDYNAGYSCQRQQCSTCRDANGYSYDCNCYYYWSTCYPTVCDQPGYYPHRDEGRTTEYVGGAVAVAGLAILLINRHDCF